MPSELGPWDWGAVLRCLGTGVARARLPLGRAAALRRAGADEPWRGAPIATLNLTTDFVGTAQQGAWVEVHVDVQKAGRSVGFANAYLVCGGERIARASAVFKVLRPLSS